jgi:DNA-binding transcriptional ArsR family regulator
LEMPRQLVNYHLRKLERAGLVKLGEERKKGDCIERVMRSTARSFVISPAAVGRLGADPALVADKLSASYLVAIAAHAIRDVSVLEGRGHRAGKTLPTLTLAPEICFRSAADWAALTEELTAEIARLVMKYHH